MKSKDYSRNIDIFDREIDRLNDMLTGMDPTSEDYAKVCDAIKKINDTKLTEQKCYTEYKEHLIPDALPKLLSIGVTAGLCVMIYVGEKHGLVISSTASTLLNKTRF